MVIANIEEIKHDAIEPVVSILESRVGTGIDIFRLAEGCYAGQR